VQEITYLPQMDNSVTGDAVAMFERFLDMLNELEDVQEIYHNGTFED
jgi:transcriptional/translational regulatory protein YebC/TACO1